VSGKPNNNAYDSTPILYPVTDAERRERNIRTAEAYNIKYCRERGWKGRVLGVI